LKFVWGMAFIPLQFWADGQLFEFVAGCVVGWLFVTGRLASLGIGSACLAMAFGAGGLLLFGVYNPGVTRLFVFGVPAALLVMGAVSLEQQGGIRYIGAAKFLGDASYSLYLTHLFPIALLRKAWVTMRLPEAGLDAALLFTALSIGLGI